MAKNRYAMLALTLVSAGAAIASYTHSEDNLTQPADVHGTQAGRTVAPSAGLSEAQQIGKPGQVCGPNGCDLVSPFNKSLRDAADPAKLNHRDSLELPPPTAPDPHAVYWVTYKQAQASPKDDWFCVVSDDCPWCDRALALQKRPEFIAMSRDYDCVLIKNPPKDDPWCAKYGIYMLPTDLFVSAKNGIASRAAGCPVTENRVPSLPVYLFRMSEGHKAGDPQPEVNNELLKPGVRARLLSGQKSLLRRGND